MNSTFLAVFLSMLQVNNSNSATAVSLKNFSVQNACEGDTVRFGVTASSRCTNPITRLFTPQGKYFSGTSNARFTKNGSDIFLHGIKLLDQGNYTMVAYCLEGTTYSSNIFVRVVCAKLIACKGARELKLRYPTPLKIYDAKLLNDFLEISLSNDHQSFRAISKGIITDDGIKKFDKRLRLDANSKTPILLNIRKSDKGNYTYMRWWIDGVQRIPSPFTFFLEVLDPTVLPTTGSPTTSRSRDAGTTRQTTPTEGVSANASHPTRAPLGGGARSTASMSCLIVGVFIAFAAVYTG